MIEVICFLGVLLLSRCIIVDPMNSQTLFTHTPAYATAGYVTWVVIMIAYVLWRIYRNKNK